MKKEIMKLLVYGIPLLYSLTTWAQIPSTIDLGETGCFQRRDLSVARSRMVINPFNFHTDPVSVTPSDYSNSPVLPLNIGYLTIGNQERDKGRFGREFKDLFQIRKIVVGGCPEDAVTFTTEWYPHALPFAATYSDGTSISGYDFFYDENTVIRTLQLERQGKYLLSGKIRGRAAIEGGNTLIVISSDCKYAISMEGLNKKNISFYKSEDDLKSQTRSIDNPKDASWWSIVISNQQCTHIAISFNLLSEKNKNIVKRVVNAVQGNNAEEAFTARVNEWNEFLRNKIPHPVNFELENIDAKGVTSDQLRLTYYKAWVLLAQNVLPPEKDLYPYYQIATGKASLWDEGHQTAPFSAAWESFVGLQMYAYIDTEVSWSCLKGLLSLVDSSGMLGGESLPSRKAHSAWILYQLSKDKESLKEVYPALERYLNWRIEQPRWIYKDATPETEKDAEFVVSAIIDMGYMSLIAKELEMEAEYESWIQKRIDYISQYKRWFWKTPQDVPIQYVNSFPGRNESPIMITTGMYIPEMKGDYFDGLLGKFYKYYDTDKPFAGFTAPKYPDVDFTIYGLIQNKKEVLARGLIEATLRDIVRTHSMFSESYRFDGQSVYPDGVRPSIFGLASIIDFTLLKNGYMYTKGCPSVVNLYPRSKTGVDNIRYLGAPINIKHSDGFMIQIVEPIIGRIRDIEISTGEIKTIYNE